jgi:hypothetical protein
MVLLESKSLNASRRIELLRPAFVLVLIVALAGGIGLVRCVQVWGSYAYTKLCLHGEKIENRKLMKTIGFLDLFAEGYSQRTQDLVRFEDDTRLRFGMNTIVNDIRKAGIGGAPTVEQIVMASLDDPNIARTDTVQDRIDALSRQVDMQKSTFTRMMNQVSRQYDYLAQRPAIWPVLGGRITSSFGSRVHPFFEERIFHEGVDIANTMWTPVYASADGIASFVGVKGSFGNIVLLDHAGSGYETLYGHLQQTAVVAGQPVRRGELIGYLGNSGRSTGPHLHYEVHRYNKICNPLNFILPLDIMVD